ncbi:MAG: hypothetical protein IKS17_10370 [Firmicutes bacterium]|nr:hypothetical protein [Bacillota bacterium]
MYECKRLDMRQAEYIYNTRMTNDFPKNELKPFASIERAANAGHYACFGMFDGNDMLAYSYFYKLDANGTSALLLDYFAVEKEHRHSGLGTVFFGLLLPYFKTADVTVIESENPEYAETKTAAEAQKNRLAFYAKNGCTDTGLTSRVFGAEYKILTIAESRKYAADEISTLYRGIYRSMLSPKYYTDNFFTVH